MRGDRTSVLFFETSYLRINLFLLIINLDYSSHLKRGNDITTNSEAAGGEEKSSQHRQVRE